MGFRLRLGAVAISVVLSCTAVLYGQDTQAQPNVSTHIRGVVLNSATHQPIGRALVVSADNRFASLTDDQGRFDFVIPESESRSGSGAATTGSAVEVNRPAFATQLTARKPGFLSDPARGGATFFEAKTNGKDLVLSLTPEALIVGRVVFPASDGSNKVDVEIYRRAVQEGRARWVSAGTAQTRADGSFRFAELAAGTYKVFTHEVLDRDPLTFNPGGQLYGYPPAYFPAAKDFGSAGTIKVSAGQTFTATLTPVRQAYYPVKIAVRNITPGQPLEVRVSAEGHHGPGYSLGYDESQQAIVGMLPNGNYTVDVTGYGPSGATGIINVSVKGGPMEGAIVAVVPNTSILVNVNEQFTSAEANDGNRFVSVSSAGRRSRYLNVSLEPEDEFAPTFNTSSAVAKPDSDSLVLQSVAPGRYWVRVNTYRGFVSSVTAGSVDLSREPLVVGAGGAGAPIEVTLRDDGATLEGSIEGVSAEGQAADSRPATPTVIYLIPTAGGQFKQTTFWGGNSFNLSQIVPGTYRILAFDKEQPELEYENSEAMREYDSKGVVVRLASGQTAHLQLSRISSDDK